MGSERTSDEHVRLRLYLWTCRRFPGAGYTTKVLVVALSATSVPLLAVVGVGAAGLRGPALVWSAFAGTVAGALVFLVGLTELLAPLQLATRQLGAYLDRRSLPDDAPPADDEVGVLLTEVGEACHRMEWERVVLEELAATDPLCHLLNRRGGLARIEELRAAAPPGARWCVGLVDLDRFKALNDHLGHTAGDRALKTVARRLAEIRLSAGVARGRMDEPLDELIERADAALYDAKRAGGGRVECDRPHLVVCSSDGILR